MPGKEPAFAGELDPVHQQVGDVGTDRFARPQYLCDETRPPSKWDLASTSIAVRSVHLALSSCPERSTHLTTQDLA